MLKNKFQLAKADVCCVISAHAGFFPKTFSLSDSDAFQTTFKEFGILNIKKFFTPARELNAELIRLAKKDGPACQRVSVNNLDYGTAIALHLLGVSAEQKLMVVGTCQRSINDHLRFGSICKEVLQKSTARVAIIITGDGSLFHSSDSPAGFSPQAKLFDEGVVQSLAHRSVTGLERVQREYPQKDECILRPLACGYGILRNFPASKDIITFEILHGVGLITASLFQDGVV